MLQVNDQLDKYGGRTASIILSMTDGQIMDDAAALQQVCMILYLWYTFFLHPLPLQTHADRSTSLCAISDIWIPIIAFAYRIMIICFDSTTTNYADIFMDF